MNRGIFLLGLLLLIGCSEKRSEAKFDNHSSNYKASREEPVEEEVDLALMDVGNGRGGNQYNPKLIKRGSLEIATNDIEKTKKQVYNFVKKCQGYIEKENSYSRGENNYCQLTVNVKASEFDRFIALADSVELNVINKSFSVDDVTASYIDDSTRLENKRKLENRYLELLNKAKEMKEILEIEEKLEVLRSDIESRQNQMNVLNKQIAYSTFEITLEKEGFNHTFDNRNKYSNKLVQGLLNGWEGLKAVSIFILSIWPVYIVLIGIFYFIRMRKRSKNK